MSGRGWRSGLASLVEAIRGAGFRKRAGTQFTLDLDEGVLGWVGLNMATRAVPGTASIHPVIGVHFRDLERRVAELCDRKPFPYHPAVTEPLYVALGQHRVGRTLPRWDLTGDLDDHRVVGEIVEALEGPGLMWIRERATMPGLVAAMRDGDGLPGQTIYYLPVALRMVAGRAASAKVINQTLARMAGRTDPAADYYRIFATALLVGSPSESVPLRGTNSSGRAQSVGRSSPS